jgi:hypothetical protein
VNVEVTHAVNGRRTRVPVIEVAAIDRPEVFVHVVETHVAEEMERRAWWRGLGYGYGAGVVFMWVWHALGVWLGLHP